STDPTGMSCGNGDGLCSGITVPEPDRRDPYTWGPGPGGYEAFESCNDSVFVTHNPGICPGDEHNFPISYRPVAVMNLYPALAPYIPQAIKMGQHLMRTLRAQGEFLGRMASK